MPPRPSPSGARGAAARVAAAPDRSARPARAAAPRRSPWMPARESPRASSRCWATAPRSCASTRPKPSEEDVYISAAQVRRCELVSGDQVTGPVRTPRRSERYPSLVRIDTINGESADAGIRRIALRGPSRRLAERAAGVRLPRRDARGDRVAHAAGPRLARRDRRPAPGGQDRDAAAAARGGARARRPRGQPRARRRPARGDRRVGRRAGRAGRGAQLRRVGRRAGPGRGAGARRRQARGRPRRQRARADRQPRRAEPAAGAQGARRGAQPARRRLAHRDRDRERARSAARRR